MKLETPTDMLAALDKAVKAKDPKAINDIWQTANRQSAAFEDLAHARVFIRIGIYAGQSYCALTVDASRHARLARVARHEAVALARDWVAP